MNNTNTIASCVHVTKRFGYNGRATAALNDVSLEIHRGELVLLLGPSGSGKTTLLSVLGGLMRPDSGKVLLFGRGIEEFTSRELQQIRARKIGFIFQNFLLLEPLTLGQNVEVVMTFCSQHNQQYRQKVSALLAQLGIAHLMDSYPAQTSQGEKQRAAIARALANDAELVLADEPTASLESSQGAAVVRILRELAHEERRCVVVASHDLRLMECADRVAYLQDGTIERMT